MLSEMHDWHAVVLSVPQSGTKIETQTVFSVLHPDGSNTDTVLLGSYASALHRWPGLWNALQVWS